MSEITKESKAARFAHRKDEQVLRHMANYSEKRGDLWRFGFFDQFGDLLPSYDSKTGIKYPSICFENAKRSGTLFLPYAEAFPEELQHNDRNKRPSRLLRGLNMSQLHYIVQEDMRSSGITQAQILAELSRLTESEGRQTVAVFNNFFDQIMFPIYRKMMGRGFDHRELTHGSMRWRSVLQQSSGEVFSPVTPALILSA